MKKVNGKKAAALFLSAVCAFSFTACGNGKNNDASPAAKTETSEADLSNPYGYENPITLKVGLAFNSDFGWAGDESAEQNTWTDLYKENGMNLDIMYNVDGSQQDTKRTTAIASGNYPDIMSVSGADLVKYAQTGVIADITDAYEQYATDQLKEYETLGGKDYLPSAMVDGKLYGVPQVTDYRGDAMMMFIRQDWLDSLNLEIPTTMEELKEVALAFTTQDPDGNGQDDTYGLALNGKEGFNFWSGVQAFFEGYGAAPGYWNGQFSFIEKDGEVVWGGALADEMKAALTDLQEMYQNGSLAKNFGTMDYNQITQDVGAGKCGIYFAPRWGAMVPVVDATKNDPDCRIVSAKIPDGFGEGSSKPYIPSTPGTYYVVSSKCANPEALIKLCNLSVQKLCNYESAEEYDKYTGKAGEYSGWKAALVQLTSQTEAIDSIANEHEAVTTGNTDVLTTESEKVNVKNMEIYKAAVEDGTLIDKLNAGDENVQAGIGMWTVDGDELGGGITMVELMEENNYNYCAYGYIPTETMSSKFSTLDKMALETIVKIITGESVDSYDTFLESWKALGGEAVTQEAQEWYDANH